MFKPKLTFLLIILITTNSLYIPKKNTDPHIYPDMSLKLMSILKTEEGKKNINNIIRQIKTNRLTPKLKGLKALRTLDPTTFTNLLSTLGIKYQETKILKILEQKKKEFLASQYNRYQSYSKARLSLILDPIKNTIDPTRDWDNFLKPLLLDEYARGYLLNASPSLLKKTIPLIFMSYVYISGLTTDTELNRIITYIWRRILEFQSWRDKPTYFIDPAKISEIDEEHTKLEDKITDKLEYLEIIIKNLNEISESFQPNKASYKYAIWILESAKLLDQLIPLKLTKTDFNDSLKYFNHRFKHMDPNITTIIIKNFRQDTNPPSIIESLFLPYNRISSDKYFNFLLQHKKNPLLKFALPYESSDKSHGIKKFHKFSSIINEYIKESETNLKFLTYIDNSYLTINKDSDWDYAGTEFLNHDLAINWLIKHNNFCNHLISDIQKHFPDPITGKKIFCNITLPLIQRYLKNHNKGNQNIFTKIIKKTYILSEILKTTPDSYDILKTITETFPHIFLSTNEKSFDIFKNFIKQTDPKHLASQIKSIYTEDPLLSYRFKENFILNQITILNFCKEQNLKNYLISNLLNQKHDALLKHLSPEYLKTILTNTIIHCKDQEYDENTTQTFFEIVFIYLNHTISNSKPDINLNPLFKKLELLNFRTYHKKQFIETFPALITEPEESFTHFLKYLDEDSFFILRDLIRYFPLLKDYDLKAWQSLFDKALRFRQFLPGKTPLKLTQILIANFPELFFSETDYLTDLMLESFKGWPADFYSSGLFSAIGILHNILVPLKKTHPDLFQEKNKLYLTRIFSELNKLLKTYQEHITPITPYSFHDLTKYRGNTRHNSELIYQALLSQNYIKGTAISNNFKPNTKDFSLNLTKQLTHLFRYRYESVDSIIKERLTRFYDPGLQFINNLIKEYPNIFSPSFLSQPHKFETVIKEIQETIKLVTTHPILKTDLGAITTADFENIKQLSKSQKQELLKILQTHEYCNEHGKILPLKIDKLAVILYEKQDKDSDFTKDLSYFLDNKTPPKRFADNRDWIEPLLQVLKQKKYEHNPISQFFTFIPKMNPRLKDLYKYLPTINKQINALTSTQELELLYKGIQTHSNINDIAKALKTSDSPLLSKLNDWQTFKNLPEDDQYNLLHYSWVYKYKKASLICHKIIRNYKTFSPRLLISSLKTLKRLGLPNYKYSHISTQAALIQIFKDQTMSLNTRSLAARVLWSLDFNPKNLKLRDLFYNTLINYPALNQYPPLLRGEVEALSRQGVCSNQKSYTNTLEKKIFTTTLLKLLHNYIFAPTQDRDKLKKLSKLTSADPEISVNIAILLSDQKHLNCLITAWNIINSDIWPYPTELPETTKGFIGGFTMFSHRPKTLEYSKHHMLWKIKLNLARLHELENPSFRDNIDKRYTKYKLDPISDPLFYTYDFFIKNFPNVSRFHALPFIYPNDCLIFRGIGQSDGETQTFEALIDHLAQGSASADLTGANAYGQTSSKSNQLFATHNIEIVTNERYFSKTNGFILSIDPIYFNMLVHKSDYRIEREGSFNTVIYNKIPPIAILSISLPKRYQKDLSLIYEQKDIKYISSNLTTKEFKKLSNEKLLNIKTFLTHKTPKSISNNELIDMYTRLFFFNEEEDPNIFLEKIAKKENKKIYHDSWLNLNSSGGHNILDPAISDSILKNLIAAQESWHIYKTKFLPNITIPDWLSLEQPDFNSRLTEMQPFLPWFVRITNYIEYEEEEDPKTNILLLLTGLHQRYDSYWQIIKNNLENLNIKSTISLFIIRSITILDHTIKAFQANMKAYFIEPTLKFRKKWLKKLLAEYEFRNLLKQIVKDRFINFKLKKPDIKDGITNIEFPDGSIFAYEYKETRLINIKLIKKPDLDIEIIEAIEQDKTLLLESHAEILIENTLTYIEIAFIPILTDLGFKNLTKTLQTHNQTMLKFHLPSQKQIITAN